MDGGFTGGSVTQTPAQHNLQPNSHWSLCSHCCPQGETHSLLIQLLQLDKRLQSESNSHLLLHSIFKKKK